MRKDSTVSGRLSAFPDLPDERHSPVCTYVRGEAAGFVLRALAPAEDARVRDHLLLCPDCERAIERLEHLTSLVALASPATSPSATVKAQLMRRVETAHPVPATRTRRPVRLPGRPARWVPSLPAAAAAWRLPAAAVLVLALLGFTALSSSSTRDSRVAQLEASNRSMTAHLVAIRQGRLEFGDDALVYPLLMIEAGQQGQGGVLLGDPNEPRALLSLWNVDAQAGEYQVTLEDGNGQRAAVGAIVVDGRGAGSLDLSISQPIVYYRVVHVTTPGQPDLDIFTLRLDEPGNLLESTTT